MSAGNVSLGQLRLGEGNTLYNAGTEMTSGGYVYNKSDPERLQPKNTLRAFVLTLKLADPGDLELLRLIRQVAAAGSGMVTAEERQWVPDEKTWYVLLIGYIREVMAPKDASTYWIGSAVKALEAINKKQGVTNEQQAKQPGERLPGEFALGEAGRSPGQGEGTDRKGEGVSV